MNFLHTLLSFSFRSVCARCRPPLENDKKLAFVLGPKYDGITHTIIENADTPKTKTHHFDSVCGEESTAQQVYIESGCQAVVAAVRNQGYNGAISTYGQTNT